MAFLASMTLRYTGLLIILEAVRTHEKRGIADESERGQEGSHLLGWLGKTRERLEILDCEADRRRLYRVWGWALPDNR